MLHENSGSTLWWCPRGSDSEHSKQVAILSFNLILIENEAVILSNLFEIFVKVLENIILCVSNVDFISVIFVPV